MVDNAKVRKRSQIKERLERVKAEKEKRDEKESVENFVETQRNMNASQDVESLVNEFQRSVTEVSPIKIMCKYHSEKELV